MSIPEFHDLDGDGHNEVIYCMGFEIVVVDGGTGKLKYKAPLPLSKPPANRYPRILGDCLFFCDLRGMGRPRNIITKDRYWHFWALTGRLEPLWEGSCAHGPLPLRCRHRWRRSRRAGNWLQPVRPQYRKLLWTLENQVQDHADGIAIVNFVDGEQGGAAPSVFYTASDSGVVYADLKGSIIQQHFIGHAQNPAIAKFQPDLPGARQSRLTSRGNQGILHFFDVQGQSITMQRPIPLGVCVCRLTGLGSQGVFRPFSEHQVGRYVRWVGQDR